MGNAINLSEICDDYIESKVHRFEGSKVQRFFYSSYDMQAFIDTFGEPKNNRYHPLSRLSLAFGPPQGATHYAFSKA